MFKACEDALEYGSQRRADLEKARNLGIEQYNLEQREKIKILSWLLSDL